MKCINFTLPSGSGGMAAGHALQGIRKKLTKFCEQYKIDSYYSATEGYNFYVWFNEDKFYTLFVLVWDNKEYWRQPTIVEKDKDSAPYNRKTTIIEE